MAAFSGTARAQLRQLARDPVLFVLLMAIAVSIAVFVIYPLIKVLLASFQVDGAWSFAGYAELAERKLYRNALINSLGVGALVGVIGVAIGFVNAFVLTRLDVPGKTLLHYLTILPIISPPFVSAVSILFLFGFNGLVTRQLLGLEDFSIYGFHGVVLSQVFTFAPIAYLSLRGVLASLSPTLEDAALNIGATRWQAFWKVSFPLALPGIASAFLVVFIESMADFGNPLVLAGAAFPMLAPQAYLEITGSFNLSRGATLAIVLLIPSMTAFAIQRYYLSKRQYITVTGKPTASTSKVVSPAAKWVLYGVTLLFALLVTAFYAVILVGAFTKVWGFNYAPTIAHFLYVFDVGFESVKDTLVVALVTTPVSGLLGMLVAFLVVRRNFPGRTALEFGSILSFDAKLREQMRVEIRELQQRVGITSIYVTHDQVEAMSISDEIVVMNAGVVEQVGTPHAIYARPASRFVADFIGKANFLAATVADGETVEIAGVRLPVADMPSRSPGETVTAVLRPEAIHLSPDAGPFKGTVRRVMFLGNIAEYLVEVDGVGSWIVDSANPAEAPLHRVGEPVFLTPSRHALHLLP